MKSSIADIARNYVLAHYPDVRKSFFDRAWTILSERFALAQTSEQTDISLMEQPLGMAGRSTEGPVKTIILFVAADQWIKAGKPSNEMLIEIRKLAKHYEERDKAVEEVLALLSRQFESSAVAGSVQGGMSVGAKEFRAWFKDSLPEGEAIDRKRRNVLVKDKKYSLVVVREPTSTTVFINQVEQKRSLPGETAYDILAYVLKHRGWGGKASNIAYYAYDLEDDPDVRKLGHLAKKVKQQPQHYEALKLQNEVDKIQSRLSFDKMVIQTIKRINAYLGAAGFTPVLTAQEQGLDEYRFVPMPEYCLIEDQTTVPLPE